MQRHEMISALKGLGLKGMVAAFDDAVTHGIRRDRSVMEMLGDLLHAEVAHREAASIRYRMTAAWSAAPAPARRTWPLPSLPPWSVPGHEGGSLTPSIWSIGSRKRPVRPRQAALQRN